VWLNLLDKQFRVLIFDMMGFLVQMYHNNNGYISNITTQNTNKVPLNIKNQYAELHFIKYSQNITFKKI
jgi:hypothetical protein